METRELLKKWNNTKHQELLIVDICIKDCFQPRAPHSFNYDERIRARNESKAHVLSLVQLMTMTMKKGRITLDPILVARLPDGLFVIDGHHRLRAHKELKREHISARVLEVREETAIQAATLCNIGEVRSLGMKPAQQRQAAWLYLGSLLKWGKNKSAQLPSQRVLAREFQITKSTAQRMMKSAVRCDPSEFQGHLVDGVNWPYYRRLAAPQLYEMDKAYERVFGPGSASTHRDNRKRERAFSRVRSLIDDYGVGGLVDMVKRLMAEHETDDEIEHVQALDALREPEEF